MSSVVMPEVPVGTDGDMPFKASKMRKQKGQPYNHR
jgi:hypothetical protein